MSQNKPDFPNPQPDPVNSPAAQYFQNTFNTQIPPPTTSANELVDFTTDIQGLFETVSTAPTLIPKSPFDQVKIYSNAGTFRLYIYDVLGATWHYASLT